MRANLESSGAGGRQLPAQSRVGDKSKVDSDAHGCPACPHPCVGPAVAGSPDVIVNGKPAVRLNDPGIHAACCGPNTWTATKGSDSVFINGLPAHRDGDDDKHCGGAGAMIEGSPDVLVGGGKTDQTRDSKRKEPEDKPHETSYEITLVDALGRELADATVEIRCPHEAPRTETFTGKVTLENLCEDADIEIIHPVEEVEWHAT